MVARVREIHGARSLVGPAGTRTMAADRPGRRSALSAAGTPCRGARVRRRRSTPGLAPSFHSEGWGVRTAEVRYQTRRCWSETSPQISHISMISEMVLWEWEIQEPRKVEAWRLPGRAPAVRTPQPCEWTDGSNPEVERCGWRRARAGGPNLTTPPKWPDLRRILPTTSASNDRFIGPRGAQRCNFGARRVGARGVIWERAEPGWCGGIFLGGVYGGVIALWSIL